LPTGSWRRFELGCDRRPVTFPADGLDQLVWAGEVALQQLLGRRRGDRARVEATEEDLDQGPCNQGREHPLLGFVEGGDVEREGVTQRRRGDARRERLVHMDDVQRVGFEQPLHRVPGEDVEDLVATPPQLLRDSPDELVDAGVGGPPVRRDLGNREGLAGHGPGSAR
jgi:hypothetical protein